ncbi:MAG: carbohydrate ABC transporter permease [Phycisphaerales bacterium]
MNEARRETLWGLAFTSPWLVGSAAFMFLPMAISLYYSFTDYPMLEPPLWVGLDNYRRMLHDPVFRRAVSNTLIFASVSIPLVTAAALVLAALLSSPLLGRMRSFYQVAVFIPTLVPLVASAMVWSWLFNGENGLVNRLLALVGIDGPIWLSDTNDLVAGSIRAVGLDPPAWLPGATWALLALLLMTLWSVGQAVVIYIAAMQDIPTSLYEAAELDGMGPVRRFRSITIPMLSPVILFNVIVLTINTLQIFAAPYIMFRTKDGTNPGGLFYSMYLYDNAFVYLQMGYASAMAWLLLIATLFLTAVLFLASRRLVYYHA